MTIALNWLLEKANKKLNVTGMNPETADKTRQVIEEMYAQGIYVCVAQAYRSIAEQNAVYAIGRTAKCDSCKASGKACKHVVTNAKGGQSNHNFGVAVDLFIYSSDGKSADFDVTPNFRKVVAAMKAKGFKWGGDWKSFQDNPHFELYNVVDGEKIKPYTPTATVTASPTFPTGIYHIQTGGYAGAALGQVHEYLFKTGHGFNVKRGADGSIVFLIGPFDTSQPNFKNCEQFLRGNGHKYELISREKAEDWKPKIEESPHAFIYTGGFSGTALLEVHDYLFKKGFGFDVTRGEDGSLKLKIGPFDLSQPVFWECRGFFVLGKHEFTVK
ncbi:M15 family metallopeptidase [Bacillus sp. OTU530]|uniref:M15 family metallopeptidase n=1 Tax=Bacillus sp. OTU530 TaxID=3043862 RepID=UPI00313B6963